MRDEASELDRALSQGSGASGSSPLVDVARDLEAGFQAPVPRAARERALFVEGVAAQRPRRSWLLLAAPAAVLGGIFVLFLAVAGRALPGDSLYAVRKVMGSVGLAQPATSDVRDVLREASRHVTEARRAADESPARARREAIFALGRLGVAREWLKHIDGGGRAGLIAEIERIERQATAALYLASEDAERLEERAERIEERSEEGGGDSSGPGSGDDGDDVDGDSSGSGSGDDDSGGDDSSGSGSDGDDGDDSSGSGSGDGDDSGGSGSGSDDSSGSGSGGDDGSGSDSDLEDNSGPGSDSELELDDDRSGSGGGDED